MARHDRIVVILGPTAGGKSELAVAIAQRCDGQIINADSMQVYRHLDAGTAKPTAAQRAAAPHHLIDCVEPTERWTVADWLARAEQLIADLHAAGKLPIVVGGTNLYLKALLEGMFDGPPADPAFRESVAEAPAPKLHARLAAVDPAAAERIHRNDHKRIIRALEVHRATGKPISEQQAQWDSAANEKSKIENRNYHHDPILIGLRWPIEAINRRINARVKAMFFPAACGLAPETESLVDETRRLEVAGLLGPQAREALGTKQALDHLAGRLTLDECFEQTKIDTRRYAKAQRTWLKRFRGVRWFESAEQPFEQIARQAVDQVKRETGEL